MTATVTDLFCGAGGSSLGAEYAGAQLVMAANHWQTAIDVHQAHFPDAGHDCADISQADPRRYPRTDGLIASPECTNHSQARGVSRRRQDPTLWDAPDPSAERSRATMWDVPRFAEQLDYDWIVTENVVEAAKWRLFAAWWLAMESLGYVGTILSHNSMHHGVPQSRDRIYVVWLKRGLERRVNLEFEQLAPCPRCNRRRAVRQAWKNGRTVGRFGPQWVWKCTSCASVATPATVPAEKIIDWSLPTPRIGDRGVTPCPKCGRKPCNRHWKPLVENTRVRIGAGLQRYGWVAPTSAFLFNPAHGGRVRDLADPLPTVCASDDRHALVLTNRTHATPRSTDEPMTTVCAGGTHHALIVNGRSNDGGDPGRRVRPTGEPLSTVTAVGTHLGLLMRNNTARGDQGQMVTSTDEPARSMTTKGHQSLLVPYNGKGVARPVDEPLGTQPATDRWSLVDVEAAIDDCGFRMLEPYEVTAAQAFPDGYIPLDLPNVVQVKLAGNAVTPPVMAWIVGRILQGLES